MSGRKVTISTSQLTSETKKIEIEVKDLLQLIDDQENKRKPIKSPEFSVGGHKFKILVYPEQSTPQYIGVHLMNDGQDQTTSCTMSHASVGKVTKTWTNKVTETNIGLGFPDFLPHEHYRNWVKQNQDIFKVEVSLTLHIKKDPAPEVPLSLRQEDMVTSVNKVIMDDDSTADLTLRCDTKAFKVHRSFFCVRSPVFRSLILGSKEENKKGEIFIKDLNEKTLETVIIFTYTGDLEISQDMDVQNLARAGEKYDLPGFTDLLCYNLSKEDNLKPEILADILIASYRHNNQKLRSVAMEKIRADRSIVYEDEFRKILNKANDPENNIIFDLFNDL